MENIEQLKTELLKRYEKTKTRQRISDGAYCIAKENVKSLKINNIQDAILYFACLNLINAYAKQNDIDYNFKKYISKGFEQIIKKDLKNVTYCVDADNALIVNICDIQFSFHHTKPSEKMIEATSYFKQQTWGGVKLQMIADSLFYLASAQQGLSNEYFENETNLEL